MIAEEPHFPFISYHSGRREDVRLRVLNQAAIITLEDTEIFTRP